MFAHGINYANTLTRVREGYHEAPAGLEPRVSHHDAEGAPSMHELEEQMRLNELPPLDPEPRTLIRERGLDALVDQAMFERGDYAPTWSVSRTRLGMEVEREEAGVVVRCRAVEAGVPVFEKSYHFRTGGGIVAEYRWHPAAIGPESRFTAEVSYGGPWRTPPNPPPRPGPTALSLSPSTLYLSSWLPP